MKIFFLILGTVWIGLYAPFVNAQPVGSATLVPSVTCTEKACPPETPCCNSCQFNGWVIREAHLKAVSENSDKPLPACEPDGCGVCPFLLKVQGKQDHPTFSTVFYVTEWSKIDNDREEGSYRPWVSPRTNLPVDPQVSEEERKKAIDEWMKDMKKQSDANMEKLKKENPEQYQKLEQFMNMLKTAVPKEE